MADPESLAGLPAVVRRHELAVLKTMDERSCSRDCALEIIAREQPALSVAFRSAHIAHRRRLARESAGVRNYLI